MAFPNTIIFVKKITAIWTMIHSELVIKHREVNSKAQTDSIVLLRICDEQGT